MDRETSTAGGSFSKVNSFQSAQRQNFKINSNNNFNNNPNFGKGNTNQRTQKKNRNFQNNEYKNNSSNFRNKNFSNRNNMNNNSNLNANNNHVDNGHSNKFNNVNNNNHFNNNGNNTRYNKNPLINQKKSNVSNNTGLQSGFTNNIIIAPQAKSNSNDSNNFRIKYFGALINHPEQAGFVKFQPKAHKVPKYLLKENTLFDMSSFERNEWDHQNQIMLSKREQEYKGEPQLLFEEFQEHRKLERQMMEKFNLVDKENAKKSLDDAIIFRGSCEDMCPIYERVERVFKNQVSKWEKDPATNKISPKYALKTFMRPSGQAPPLPSDVRPPHILQKSLAHIIDNLLPHLPESQSFIWDRTRSIRQDFTFQNNYSGIESIDCHEKICRIHILSLHVMAGANDPDYQQHQEVEQFNNSLQTLTHMYDDVRSRGGYCPNEPEFRAYELISKIKDTEIERFLQTLPNYIQDDPIVRRAIILRNMVSTGLNSLNLYSEFFYMVLDKVQTPFLLASLAEIHFNEIRFNALRIFSKVYHSKAKKLPSIEELTRVLRYNDSDQLLETCRIYSLPVVVDPEDGINRIDILSLKSAYKPSQKQAYTKAIDLMIQGRSMSVVINSGKPNNELNLKRPQSLEEIARESFKESKQNSDIVAQIFANNKISNIANPSFFDHQSINQGPDKRSAMDSMNKNLPLGNNNSQSFQFDTSANPEFSVQLNKNNQSNAFSNTSGFMKDSFNQVSNAFNSQPDSNFEILTQEINKPFLDSMLTKNTEKESKNEIVSQNNVDIKKPAISIPPKKKLIENPAFAVESKKVADKLINEYVQNLTNKVVKEKVSQERAQRQHRLRNNTISKLSNELFRSFMKEQIYLVALEGYSTSFYNKNLKLKILKQISNVGKKCLEKKESLIEKTQEIEKFNTTIPVPVSGVKANYKPPPVDFQNVSLISDISDVFNDVNAENDLSLSIVLRSRESKESKWIVNQLGLESGESQKTYKDKKNNCLNISLLPDVLETKKYFKKIGAIVIQVGTILNLDDNSIDTLIQCLKRDAKVLQKLKSYLEKYSCEQEFSIIVVYVDSFDVKLPYSTVKNLLKLEVLSTSNVTLGFFKLKPKNISFNSGLSLLKKTSDNFKRILTAVWKKHFLRKNQILPKTDGTINELSKVDSTMRTELDSSLLDKSEMPKKRKFSSVLVKKKIDYIQKAMEENKNKRIRATKFNINDSVLGFPNQSLIPEKHSMVSGNSTINEDESFKNKTGPFSNMSSNFESFMILRNYNNSHDTISHSSTVFEDEKARKRLESLNELDELANSVLNK